MGSKVGSTEGIYEGSGEGLEVGAGDGFGVGVFEGSYVGISVGSILRARFVCVDGVSRRRRRDAIDAGRLPRNEGRRLQYVGSTEGWYVGAAVGRGLGAFVGSCVGRGVGSSVFSTVGA